MKTSWVRYWRMGEEERRNVCGNRDGGYHQGASLVCCLHVGHAGSHYDSVAGREWETVAHCPDCVGGLRLVHLDAGAVTVGQYRSCWSCNGTGVAA